MQYSEYLERIFNIKARKLAVRLACLKLRNLDFDAIAVRGVSGITMGSILAHELSKNLIVVRKPNESSHADLDVEGFYSCKYVIVDDFIVTGLTVDKIVEALGDNCTHVATYLYNGGGLIQCVSKMSVP